MPTIKQIKTPDNTTYDIHGVDDKAYHTDDTELTSASSLADSDYIPIYDTSDTASKKFKISNLVTRLKTLLGLGNAAYKDIKHTYDSSNEDAISGKGVADALSTLPEPMIFKGSLGTGGTVTTLPTASSSNKGYTYKVITDGTYASQSAKVGDTFISDGTTWVLIPSGDEPSGTVTSVKINATSPIAVSSTSAITTSGTRTISHETSGATAGSYGDSGNQTPTYGGTFKVPYITVNDTGHVTGISAHTVKIPSSDNTNTTYSFADGTNQFTVTPSDGSASTIKVTPQLKIDGITSDTTDKEINCYGECSTAAGTAAKTVNITKGTFALAAGSKVIVKFTNANTANNPTLNVNSKGAKNIFHNGARITTGTNKALLAGTIEFVYDGTQFQLVGNYIDTDTTYSAGTGISFDGTTINHSNSVTAGTAKGDNSKTLAFGGTFTIPSVTYDAQGHVTAKGTTTMTMPANPNTDTTYTFAGGTDKFTVTPSGGSAQTVNVANGGVRSIATGSTFGTYSVNTGGTSADKSINLTGDFQASGQDLNDIKTSGVYYFSSTNAPTNVPAGSNGILIVTAAHISSTTGLFVKQVWMRHGTNDLSDNTKAAYYSSNDQETYVRTYNNSTWSSWHKLFASTVNGNNYRANLQVSKNDGRNGQRTWTNLYVGNSTGIGTADLYVHDTDATKNRNGSQCGRIYMYNGTTTGTSNYATVLTPAANTGERTITFPNDSGTVALTKNINVVAQTDSSMSSSYNKYYRVLFSNSDNDTTENAGTRKCSQVLINPYDGSLRAGFLEIAPDVDNAILSMSNVNFAKANIKVPTTPTADYDIYLPPVGGMLALASSWTCENSSGHTGTTAFTTNILDTVSEIFLKVQLGEASNKIFIPIHIPVTTISATNDSVERWRGGYYQSSTAGGEVSYWIWKKDGYIKMHLDIAYLNGSSVASSTKVYVYYKTY